VLTSFISGPELAVNASGAGVMVWEDYGRRHFHTFAAYRAPHGSTWTPPRKVPHVKGVDAVGIDDAGRVLLVYSTRKAGLMVMRRTLSGRWQNPTNLSGRTAFRPSLAVGANGAAVVSYSRYYDEEGDDQRPFTASMSPSGRWAPPVHQPEVRHVTRATTNPDIDPDIDMDARGRALLTWWDGTDLVARWSRPGGRWRKPCVLAANVPHPRRDDLDTQVAVNRRGDALVVWRGKGHRAQLWGRYERVGHDWSKPVPVTLPGSRPRAMFASALGDGGHVAIAWTTQQNRQIDVRRAFPTQ
jgi:hypothetical protein